MIEPQLKVSLGGRHHRGQSLALGIEAGVNTWIDVLL